MVDGNGSCGCWWQSPKSQRELKRSLKLEIMVWVAICVASIGALSCSTQPNERRELLVFVAASLSNAMTDAAGVFEAQNEIDLIFSYGGSQTLAQQIAVGAPADMFISAGEFPMTFLVENGLVESELKYLTSNKLVAVTQVDGIQLESIHTLVADKIGRIGVADADLAPAGWYARQSLKRLGIWDDIQGKVVMGPDVRVTLAYVEAGNVDVALVYQTDARVARNIRVLDIVPQDSYSRVAYPAAVVKSSDRKPDANAFLEFLGDEVASEIFRNHGFIPLIGVE